jgi:hypothetical protein
MATVQLLPIMPFSTRTNLSRVKGPIFSGGWTLTDESLYMVFDFSRHAQKLSAKNNLVLPLVIKYKANELAV